ncbi:class II fructose-bisphosphate aldolase [Novispirillum sp. DQ9]|uniref:class II fructose-bisphosphate aldolase n=1 Tax=Novispirillum sp. DQ9 TaxID=3398612 RepID=UPI003C7B4D01
MEPYAALAAADADCVVVHTPQHVRAALAAAYAAERPVILASAPGAAQYQGPGWLLRVARTAASGCPGVRWTLVLDAGDAAGFALAALEAGVPAVCVDGLPREGLRSLRAIADGLGATVLEGQRDGVDLLSCADPVAACRSLLNPAAQGI